MTPSKATGARPSPKQQPVAAGSAPRLTRAPVTSPGRATVTPDDLDREQLEQLHAATLRASDSCFELKKLCATVLVPTATLISVFTDERVNIAMFVAAALVVTGFWIADSFSYYYQRKLRAAMRVIWLRRGARLEPPYVDVPAPLRVSWWRAGLNTSMVFYLILGLILAVGFALLQAGWIGEGSG